jgi:hypothetical protein
MTELEIGGNAYRINNMPAMTQFHVMRKLGPVLPGIVPVLAQAAAALPQADGQEDGGAMTTVDGVAAIAMAACPLLDGLAAMADADAEYVINHCLSAVMRRDSGGKSWSAVSRDGVTMFDDIDLMTSMQIVWAVLRENYTGFFRAASTALAPAQ